MNTFRFIIMAWLVLNMVMAVVKSPPEGTSRGIENGVRVFALALYSGLLYCAANI